MTSKQVPLPGHIRTERFWPRFLAAVLLVACGIGLWRGLEEFGRRDVPARTILDPLLVGGESFWGVFSSARPGDCSAALAVKLESREKFEIGISGVTAAGKAPGGFGEIEARATFSEYRILEEFDLAFRSASRRYEIRSANTDGRTIVVSADGEAPWKTKYPGPALLLDTEPGVFRISGAPALRRLLAIPAAPDGEEDIVYQKFDRAEFDRCKEFIQQGRGRGVFLLDRFEEGLDNIRRVAGGKP